MSVVVEVWRDSAYTDVRTTSAGPSLLMEPVSNRGVPRLLVRLKLEPNTMPRCTCGREHLRHSRVRAYEWPLKLVAIVPVRCTSCWHRKLAFRWTVPVYRSALRTLENAAPSTSR